MQSIKQFTGIAMPVFTAFGWTGEETALNFALAQLELFIEALHNTLPKAVQSQLPLYGLDKQSMTVYLAAKQDVEKDAHITFYARPLSLEIALGLADKKSLEKGFKAALGDPENWHRLVTQLGPDWTLHVQQMEYHEDRTVHYQDLFKDTVVALDPETATTLINKAVYLNGESNWVTPVTISRRIPSEQIATMGRTVLKVTAEQIALLMPLLKLLIGQWKRPSTKGRTKPAIKVEPTVLPAHLQPDNQSDDHFTFVTELKPLHIRRGFINLTPEHWPFFALTARTETRPVTVYYEGRYDRHNSVWRLLPNDQARLVLSDAVHRWLEEHFEANENVQVTATRLENQEVQVALTRVE